MLIQRTWTYTYHPTFNFPATISIPTVGSGTCAASNPNKVVTNTYDGAGNLCNQRVSGCNGAIPFCYETFYEYDSHGQTKKRYNPRDCVGPASCTIPATPPPVIFHDYYADGDADSNKRARLQRITNALGHETTYAGYDLFGNVGSVTDSNNVETDYLYDGRDRVTEVRIRGAMAADDIVTENHYDTVGNLDFVRLPNCVETGVGCAFSLDYEYDGVNRLKEIRDPVGNKIVYTFDTEGNRTREEYQDAAAVVHRVTNFEYNNFNRLERVCPGATIPGVCGPVFTEYTYFNDGARQAEEDPLGHLTTFGYDELKRLTSVTQAATPNLVTTYGYDVQDNLASVRAPNSTGPGSFETTYTNSDMGWRLSANSPDTGGMSYVYDPAGNLLTTTDAIPVMETRTYDALNRLSNVTYPNSALNVTHIYDSPSVSFGKGRRTSMTDPSGTSVYHYDRRGLLAMELKTVGLNTYTTTYDYDKTGNLKQVRYPTESPLLRQGQVDYTYDAADRVSLVTTKVNGATTVVANPFSYKPFGPRTGMTFGNGVADARSYGFRYQLGTWTLGSLLGYTHTFNDDLNLIGRTDDVDPDPTRDRTFGYDEAHRLTLATGPWLFGTTCLLGNGTYTYDLNGNRQCKGEDASSTAYQYVAGKNRLDSETTGITTTTYSYNNNGNITGVTIGGSTRTFQYNQADRLIAVIDPGPTTVASYTYDGDGRRIIKATAGVTTYFLYDPEGRLLAEIVPSNGTGKDYLYLSGDPLARVDWMVTESGLTGNPGPLLVDKASPSVHLDWTNASETGSYVVRRKQVVNPADKTFNGSSIVAGTTDPTRTYNDPVLNDANRYDYKVFRKMSNDVLFFYHTDHLGTPIAMTNTAGSFEWKAEHRPFGGIHSLPFSNIVNNLRFPGQYFDLETGLYQNVFRDFSAPSGRYFEPDPVPFIQGLPSNLYTYVDSRPTVETDRLGLVSSAAECDRCCTPSAAQQEIQSSWDFTRRGWRNYFFVQEVCQGGSCGTSADRLRYDLEAFVRPKCWISSTQLTTGTAGRLFRRIIGGPFGLEGPAAYGFVHYVVKFQSCSGQGSSFFFDAYTRPRYGELDPGREIQ